MNVTLYIPDQYIDCIQVLIDLGIYSSRSEAVRTALDQFFIYEAALLSELPPDVFKSLLEASFNV